MGKTAIVSGGAKGIGRCLVRRFLERGYRVFVLDVDEAELDWTVNVHLKMYSESKALGFAVCNLRNAKEIQTTVLRAVDFLGGSISVLINNGGIANPHWKDNKTMQHRDTLNEWQAYVTRQQGWLLEMC